MPASFPERVLMTTDAVGGVWEYSLELASGLCRGGARVLLAAMGPAPSGGQAEAVAAIPGLALTHRPYRLEWMEGGESDLASSSAWLRDLAADFEPDVVHVNGYAHARLSWSCPVLVVCHSCVCSWWETVRGEPLPREWHAYRERVAAGLRRADLVIAPTKAFLGTIERLYGIDPRRAIAIPNGRDGGSFRVGFRGEPFVLACGRTWDDAKGIDIVDRLAARLPWPVFVAGGTQSPDDGADRSLEHARALGSLQQHELTAWLASASLFVSPARYEPFGLSVLEAALSGCPLLLSDLETFRELWDGAAVFVPQQDERALFEAATTLMRDPRLRQEMAVQAMMRARRYSAEVMVEAYARAYQRAMLNRRAPPGGKLPLESKEAVLNE